MLVLSYVDELLARVRVAFCNLLRAKAPEQRSNVYPCSGFTAAFEAIHAELEQRALEERKTKVANKPRAFTDSKKFANTRQGNKQSCAVGGGKAEPAASGGGGANGSGAAAEVDGAASAEAKDAEEEAADGLSAEQIAANRAKLRAGGGPPGRKKGAGGGKGGEEEGAAPVKKGKEARSWDGEAPGKQSLDFSKKEERGAARPVKVFTGKRVDLNERFGDVQDDEDEDEEDEGAAAAAAVATGKGGEAAASGSLWSSLKGLVGAKQLERTDLAPVIEHLQGEWAVGWNPDCARWGMGVRAMGTLIAPDGHGSAL